MPHSFTVIAHNELYWSLPLFRDSECGHHKCIRIQYVLLVGMVFNVQFGTLSIYQQKDHSIIFE